MERADAERTRSSGIGATPAARPARRSLPQRISGYTLAAADVGSTLVVVVTAANKNGSTAATSAPTPPSQAGGGIGSYLHASGSLMADGSVIGSFTYNQNSIYFFRTITQ
jgi:hypothetical protein